ncbi:OsmC family protein [Pseudomonas sp. NPDC089554]|uniref:OsmC family protein n=1 Tax=Pseudomonas sp. NPDC089554 TaxID=3390653 RepID=UPI003CFC1A55
MGKHLHRYTLQLSWKGNNGSGTSAYDEYSRSHVIHSEGKPLIAGSSDPNFRGDTNRWNPEELLLAALSACHQLWYLSLCAEAGVTVIAYEDFPDGEMVEHEDGAGEFRSVILRPRVTLAADADIEKAEALHHTAHEKCFIARSVNFPVTCEPSTSRQD